MRGFAASSTTSEEARPGRRTTALACECVVLASDTAPVREVIRHGETDLLADFFDVDGLAQQALQVLRKGSIPRQEKPRANTGCPTLPVGMA